MPRHKPPWIQRNTAGPRSCLAGLSRDRRRPETDGLKGRLVIVGRWLIGRIGNCGEFTIRRSPAADRQRSGNYWAPEEIDVPYILYNLCSLRQSVRLSVFRLSACSYYLYMLPSVGLRAVNWWCDVEDVFTEHTKQWQQQQLCSRILVKKNKSQSAVRQITTGCVLFMGQAGQSDLAGCSFCGLPRSD